MRKRNNVFKVEMNIAGGAGASKGADKRATACCAIVLCGRGCNAARNNEAGASRRSRKVSNVICGYPTHPAFVALGLQLPTAKIRLFAG